ncbi:MAG: hypothetical protein GY913_04640 [Proteobacteria bacterium]|nr:hypothetical protein [Pseudomonadota bacterium]MCP4916188.1 hypothetical protein [Pseudomonadota bacterium]
MAAQDDVTVLATADTLVLLETGAWVELPDHPADLALRGDLVAVGLADGRILLHRLPDLEHVATLRGHTGRVAALAFDGDQLVSGSWDGDVRI